MKKDKIEQMFEKGDIVRLKSGGRKCVIESIWDVGNSYNVRVIYATKKGKIISQNGYSQEVFEKVDDEIKCN